MSVSCQFVFNRKRSIIFSKRQEKNSNSFFLSFLHVVAINSNKAFGYIDQIKKPNDTIWHHLNDELSHMCSISAFSFHFFLAHIFPLAQIQYSSLSMKFFFVAIFFVIAFFLFNFVYFLAVGKNTWKLHFIARIFISFSIAIRRNPLNWIVK